MVSRSTSSHNSRLQSPPACGHQRCALIRLSTPLPVSCSSSQYLANLYCRACRALRVSEQALLFGGRNAQSGLWETLQPSERYAELQAGVQLASRSGALNAIEYSEFVTKCHRSVKLSVHRATARSCLDSCV